MNNLVLKVLSFFLPMSQDLYCRQLVVVDEQNAVKRQRYIDNVNAAKAAVRNSQQELAKFDAHAGAHTERTQDELEFYGYNGL